MFAFFNASIFSFLLPLLTKFAWHHLVFCELLPKMMSAPIHTFIILNESHEWRTSLTLPASDCTSCLNVQLQLRSRCGWEHQCFRMNVIWPSSNFQMHYLAGNNLNAPPDCRSTRIHNYRQTPRLPSYSQYPGKSRVRLHRTRISLLSWLLLQSPPFIKLQEWVLLTLGGWKWRDWISVKG